MFLLCFGSEVGRKRNNLPQNGKKLHFFCDANACMWKQLAGHDKLGRKHEEDVIVMILLLIRHGQSEADLLNVHEGRADYALCCWLDLW